MLGLTPVIQDNSLILNLLMYHIFKDPFAM